MKKMAHTLFLCVATLFCTCFMTGSPQEAYKKGVTLIEEGKPKKAFKAFRYAAKKAPDSTRYLFAAAQTAPDQNTAFMYTKFAWEKGLKNKTIFLSLLKLSFHTDKKQKLDYALTLFRELPDSIATSEFKGDLFFKFDQADSALAVWESEFRKTNKSALCPKIAQAMAKTGRIDQAIDFLYENKNKKNLDIDGYTLLATFLAMDYNFPEVDRLYDELSGSNLYNDKLRIDYATYLVFNNHIDRARPLLRQPAALGTPNVKALLNLRLRTLKIFALLSENSIVAADSLSSTALPDTALRERISEILPAIKAHIKKDSSAYDLLLKARKKLPPDPVTTLMSAREAARKKRFKEAASLYRQLPKIVLWSPRIVAERARILSADGNDDEALAIISFMHKKRTFTRQSLELFRNITLKKDLLEKSQAAQKLLEKQYSNDVGLKWKGLLLAIKSAKTDSALAIAAGLSQKYPEDERFTSTYLSLLLLKKEYRQVLDKLGDSNLPIEKRKVLEASAWKGLGDTLKAISAYETALKNRKNDSPFLPMQLAEMYFQQKQYRKATALYSQLLKDTADTSGKDSVKIAILLNNNAWTIMTAGTGNLSAALNMVKRAFEIMPGNVHIIDTYAAILLQDKKYRECINVISGSKKALKEKRLLCQLSAAWEKRGDDNKAKRYLEDALKLKAQDQKLKSLLTDTQIREHIARLSQKK